MGDRVGLAALLLLVGIAISIGTLEWAAPKPGRGYANPSGTVAVQTLPDPDHPCHRALLPDGLRGGFWDLLLAP
jgi:hypothetical protein